MARIIAILFAGFGIAASTARADVIAPASKRFAVADAKETPSFQRHVIPLLGRLGCNGRACHGSFQGQGGFRLSLFGYDFEADYTALLGGDAPRADRKRPDQSLMLLKPTKTVPHRGGKRLEVGGWQYKLLVGWLKAGAPKAKESDPAFVTLAVEPQEIVFQKIGQTKQLRVVAHWADGTQEDVTPLCRFRTNDESVAEVDEHGLVTSIGKGASDIVAFYDNGVAPVQVILPVSELAGSRYPVVPTPTKIDELVVARLRKLGVTQSELCTDSEFLRRVSLDLTGTLPTAGEAAAFLADPSKNKRAKKIDELLTRPSYAAWWATKLCDQTGNTEALGPLGGERGLNREKAKQWYLWVNRRIQENMPYDKLVEGIVMAVSRKPDQSFEEHCEEMSSYFRDEKPGDFTSRKTMPYYWMRRSIGQPEAKALSFAYSFLGVSLQCAQCHKHPYDQWTKQDFDQFADFFVNIRYNYGKRDVVQKMKESVGLGKLDQDSGKFRDIFVKLAKAGSLLPFKELSVPVRKITKGKRRPNPRRRAGRVITPKLLGGDEVIAGDYDDPRQPLIDWIRQKDNPYFARSFVNRVWASYFEMGIIHPTDDLNLANPPSNPALLDYLANGFIKSGYDMKWLHRTIANSRTYQLSWRPNETNKHDNRNFSRAGLRRLPAEVLADALRFATASDDGQAEMLRDPVSSRAIGYASGFTSRRGSHYVVNLFGQPARILNCDCERSSEPSLLQTVFLRNDEDVHKLLKRRDGWLKQVNISDAKELIRQAYLRTLSRLPNEKETQIARQYLEKAESREAGLRDLIWVLINTKEFSLNH